MVQHRAFFYLELLGGMLFPSHIWSLTEDFQKILSATFLISFIKLLEYLEREVGKRIEDIKETFEGPLSDRH